jgi:RHS repeat-associated protein
VETVAGSVTGTKQFVWCMSKRCETRSSSGAITAQYFPLGETLNGVDYFYATDHLGSSVADFHAGNSCWGMLFSAFNPEELAGSTREMTNSSGVIEAQYAYDSYGRTTQLQGSLAADNQFAGYYEHAPSGLSLTRTRAYNSSLARFLNRDPIEEDGGLNLFAYMHNIPTWGSDPLGLWHIIGTNFCGPGYSSGQPGPGYGEDDPNYPREGDKRYKAPVTGPLGPLDLCCEAHDNCMNDAHHMQDRGARKKARKCCDRTLSSCAAKTGLGIGLGGIMGIKSFFRGSGSYTAE